VQEGPGQKAQLVQHTTLQSVHHAIAGTFCPMARAEHGQFVTQLLNMSWLLAQAQRTGSALEKSALVHSGLVHKALPVQHTTLQNVQLAMKSIICPMGFARLVGCVNKDNRKHRLVVEARTGCVVRFPQSTLMLGLHILLVRAQKNVMGAPRLERSFAQEQYKHWTKTMVLCQSQEKTVLRVVAQIRQPQKMKN
jgi:hypothetical protein